mgnify:CR=1 FL=1
MATSKLSSANFHDEEAAFAYLVATNVVDNVYEELTGSRLTLRSGFSRTADQHPRKMSTIDMRHLCIHNDAIAKISGVPAFAGTTIRHI